MASNLFRRCCSKRSCFLNQRQKMFFLSFTKTSESVVSKDVSNFSQLNPPFRVPRIVLSEPTAKPISLFLAKCIERSELPCGRGFCQAQPRESKFCGITGIASKKRTQIKPNGKCTPLNKAFIWGTPIFKFKFPLCQARAPLHPSYLHPLRRSLRFFAQYRQPLLAPDVRNALSPIPI